MRNATSIWLFGASSLVLSVIACGGGGGGSRDDATGGTTGMTAGTTSSNAGTTSTTAGSSPGGGSSGGSGGSATTCNPVPGSKKGDGTNLVIDDLDDTDTMFAPAGEGAGSWDFSKDTAKPGTITPAGTAELKPEAGGQMGSALHVTGSGLLGWGASLAAFLNGPTGAFDASEYGGVAFYIKGTTTVQEGANKVMIQARMPDVLPGAGSCCDASAMPVAGKECYSGHRVVVDVPADWAEVKIAWTDFKGPAWGLGSTMALDPNRIRDINFSFNHDAAMASGDGTSFDVWVDGMRFMTKDEMSNVKPGGSGGSGGSGGGSGGSGGSGGGSGGSGGSDADGGAEQ